jgi:2-polyprenyl-3-methyl-5-hydroxy-6-metoxy-1,4-benzoquinol methylase
MSDCPICNGYSHPLFKKYGYWIRVCEVCEHQFAEIDSLSDRVQRIYNDEYFQAGGAGYSAYLSEAQILRSHGYDYSKILSRYMQRGRVLDVGSAAGFMLQGLMYTGWKGKGIEPNPSMAEYARTQLRVPVETGSVEQLQTRDRYDLVTMIQVVPQFSDLKKAFASAAAVTKPKGFWLIETWNRESWTARILGKNWHEYSPPNVLHWFSPSGLRILAAQYGFREVVRGKPTRWIKGSHVKSLIKYQLKGSIVGQLIGVMVNLIPDHVTIPYPGEDLFWVLYQKD